MMQWSCPQGTAFCVVTKASAEASARPNTPAPHEEIDRGRGSRAISAPTAASAGGVARASQEKSLHTSVSPGIFRSVRYQQALLRVSMGDLPNQATRG